MLASYRIKLIFIVICALTTHSSLAADPPLSEAEDQSIENLLNSVVENESQAELFGISETPTSQLAIEEDGYISAIKYRELQEQQKLWFVILISIMTPVFLYLVLSFLKNSSDNSGTNIVNATGLILVIQATVLIVVTSTTSEQLTAAIGVIAAIAGYLFGSSTQQQKN